MCNDIWDTFDPLCNFDFDGDGEYNAIEKTMLTAYNYQEIIEEEIDKFDDL